jgi:hypothetical protein
LYSARPDPLQVHTEVDLDARTELASVWPPTAVVARGAGHNPQSPLRAIRAKCFDCSYYQVSEIRLCEATGCALWPFRAGRHPWIVEAQKTRRSDGVLSSKPPPRTRGRALPNSATPVGCQHDGSAPRVPGNPSPPHQPAGCTLRSGHRRDEPGPIASPSASP